MGSEEKRRCIHGRTEAQRCRACDDDPEQSLTAAKDRVAECAVARYEFQKAHAGQCIDGFNWEAYEHALYAAVTAYTSLLDAARENK